VTDEGGSAELIQYRVTIWPKHGATENIYMEAPDTFTAQQYTRRVYPDHRILSIKPVVDLESKGVL
jgi:hypothetical protein